jgi:hypothetical protein
MELWLKAQKIAIEKYEKENGVGSWEEADKYEREDWVFAEYAIIIDRNIKEEN